MSTINNQMQQVPGNRANQTNAQKGAQQTNQAQQTQQVAKADAVAEQTRTLAASRGDQAKFTPEAQTMLKATQVAKDVSDINQKKVDRIKQALENGEYPVDAARVAEKMVSLEKLLQG
jgi:negative regulator of flagellin synthesis FlgM